MKKRIAILGSTGSIGTQALEVVDKLKDCFDIIALSAGNNIDLLLKQIQLYHPKYVCIKDKKDIDKLKDVSVEILFGNEGLEKIAELDGIDLVLIALSGKIGLIPTIKAIKSKKDIALANKETLVMAGDIVMKLAEENKTKILPVDSEHSAIFQCLTNFNNKDIKNLIITASGGPFLNFTKKEMKNANLKETLNHPKWKMGRKITVDSATLMNKGLEVIEAHHLFGVNYNNIKVVVHPQSYLHSAVEFKDGSIIGQIGIPSMHIPIQYALTYPKKLEGIKTESFDFIKAQKMEFYEPDYEKFPALKLAFEAGEIGGSMPVCLNSANEECVFAFLNGKIKLTDIYTITKKIVDDYKPIKNPTIEEILNEDEKVRQITQKIIVSIN